MCGVSLEAQTVVSITKFASKVFLLIELIIILPVILCTYQCKADGGGGGGGGAGHGVGI